MKNYGIVISLLLLLFLSGCGKDPVGPEDTNDTTEIPEPPTPFGKVPVLSDMVIYEVNFMAFGPSCTINDVLARIDSIKALGVNVIWLMPIFPEGEVNGVGSPYAVQDYLAVNPDLGTFNDLKAFVNKAHELEMAVILDWVANHTAWDHPWIESEDWYSQDGSGNIISPPGTNWNDVADLNFSSSSMRLEMIASMKYWINTFNIDGFRCDAADMVPFDFWKQAIDSLEKLPGRNLILLAEGSRTDHFTAGFQMTFSWDFQTALKNIYRNGAGASTIFQVNASEYNSVPEGKEKLRYITNHDIYAWEAPLSDQFVSDDGSLSAFVATAFMDGVPLICSGQEIAFPYNISFFEPNPLNWTQNADIINKYKKVMTIRALLPEIRTGNLVTYNNDDVLIFKRITIESELLIINNVRNTQLTISLPEEIIDSNWQNQWDQSELELGTELLLEPYEFILAKRSL